MRDYIIKRLLMALVVIILVTIMIFLIMRLLPGDPIFLFIGPEVDYSQLTPEQIQWYRHEFGLDRPLISQYFTWMNSVVHGDFGLSLYHRSPVLDLMVHTYPITLILGSYAFILSIILGVGVGLIAGLKRGKFIDQLTTVLAYLGISTPQFWLGILLAFVFSLHLRVLPMRGFVLPTEDFWLSFKQGMASTARQMRTSLIETIRRDYIRTAWAKGLEESVIIRRHALKNSLISVVTIIGMNVRVIFGGSVIVETVFSIPGVGRLLVDSVLSKDYMVVQSLTLIMTVAIVLANLIVDISYGWLDPRVRYS
jgi:peptide/nickel transport system permease protein